MTNNYSKLEKLRLMLAKGVLVYDGAMGTNLQSQNLSVSDYGGRPGCSEALNLYSPDAVLKVHKAFINAGCQVIETNTFNANPISLSEYGLDKRSKEINLKAVQIANQAINETGQQNKVLIAGSVGPGSLLPSLGAITFDTMSDNYYQQLSALWAADVDIFQIETCQDLLQVKAVLSAAKRLFDEKQKRCPVAVSVTLEAAGTMLIGSNIDCIIATLKPYKFIDILGINCATGPSEMVRHVKYLSQNWSGLISVMPNAGLPEIVDGKPFYTMSPSDFSEYLYNFVTKYGVEIVGGCCGTTSEHLQAVVHSLKGVSPAKRAVLNEAKVSSLYSAVSLRQMPAPTLIAERTNANGARQFKELLKADDWEGMTAMGKSQTRGGAHLIDLCVAFAGRNEKNDLEKLVPMFASQIDLPLVIDSTSADSIEAALKKHAGRCIVNSVNLEDGGYKLKKIAKLASEFGAALICLAIDENGMAKSCDDKIKIFKRIHKILTEEFSFDDSDLIFDPLTFTLASGASELRDSAKETLYAIKEIKQIFPYSHSVLGVSNVSFGLSADSREVLNSVFLSEAVNMGLNIAIVNPSGIMPIFSIEDDKRLKALDLIYNRKPDGYSLKAYIECFVEFSKAPLTKDVASLSLTQQLFDKVLEGDSSGLDTLINKIIDETPPEDIINQVLLPAMGKVGDLFGSGQLQLPFVLQSAEVVKKSVSIVEPLLPKGNSASKTGIVLATVAGDVHDIGKNLVSIILSNNGYRVFDLGIRVDIDAMVREAQTQNVKTIGMSGLLVQSTLVMKENLEELNRRNFLPDIILGGAALTREFVENDLAKLYKGQVFYAKDAVDAIKIMKIIATDEPPFEPSAEPSLRLTKTYLPLPTENIIKDIKTVSSSSISEVNKNQFASGKAILTPPFIGSHKIKIDNSELFALLSNKVLFEGRWGFKQAELSIDEYNSIIEEKAKPALDALLAFDAKNNVFNPTATYGYFKCKSQNESIMIYDDLDMNVGEFSFPRQSSTPHLSIADFVDNQSFDLIALWAVTLGGNVHSFEKKLFEDDQYCNYYFLHGLGAELADCTAVYLHKKVNSELYDIDPVNRQQLKGCRYSFGYPSCPDLSQQRDLLRIINASHIGIELSNTFQMVPELSVSGFIIFNSHARYFVV